MAAALQTAEAAASGAADSRRGQREREREREDTCGWWPSLWSELLRRLYTVTQCHDARLSSVHCPHHGPGPRHPRPRAGRRHQQAPAAGQQHGRGGGGGGARPEHQPGRPARAQGGRAAPHLGQRVLPHHHALRPLRLPLRLLPLLLAAGPRPSAPRHQGKLSRVTCHVSRVTTAAVCQGVSGSHCLLQREDVPASPVVTPPTPTEEQTTSSF